MHKIERLAGALAKLLELPQHRLIYRHMETAIQDQDRANVLFEAKGYGATEQFNIEAAI